jgi:ankyrin repeat protein
MTSICPDPIWDAYQSHRDVDLLREDVLSTPWYRTPVKANGSLLERAVAYCDQTAVNVLIELGESPNLPCDDGFPLLHTAVDAAHEKNQSQDSLDIIDSLLQHNASPNALGMDGTALHRAVGFGLVAVTDLLLQHRANIEARTLVDGELTPLMHSALMGQPEMVRFLLKMGADPSARCTEYAGSLTAAELVGQLDAEKFSAVLNALRS